MQKIRDKEKGIFEENKKQTKQISIGTINAANGNVVIGDVINSSINVDNSIQRIQKMIEEKGDEDKEELLLLLDEFKEILENLEDSRHIPKNKGFMNRLSSHLSRHGWFYAEIVNLLGSVKKYQCMPVIYSDKLIFYREESSERNILANTLTKSDEWIHEKEWRIVIKDDINMGKSGIIKDFVLPREIYIGCRQQETVAENNNNRMLHNKKENEMYADLDEILQWAENNYIDVYMPIISRKEYKMMDRALKLNY